MQVVCHLRTRTHRCRGRADSRAAATTVAQGGARRARAASSDMCFPAWPSPWTARRSRPLPCSPLRRGRSGSTAQARLTPWGGRNGQAVARSVDAPSTTGASGGWGSPAFGAPVASEFSSSFGGSAAAQGGQTHATSESVGVSHEGGGGGPAPGASGPGGGGNGDDPTEGG